MKFGSQLKDAIYPEWRSYYIDYDGLKKRLRKAEKERPFTEKDETEFVELLDNNLEKVYAFHQQKMEEIRNRVDSWAQELERNISDDTPNGEKLGHIQENINQIADDINRLSRFSHLNYTGFLKIVKKHDRHTNYVLRPMFIVRLNQCPFWKEDDDTLLINLSELFSKARQGGKQMSFKPNKRESSEPGHGGRHTIVKRFFVHMENVLELKTFVLRHLPVLVYRDNSLKQDNIDPPISSLYLDNSNLDSYNSRVEDAPGSQIVRFRWYGSAKGNSTIVVERRTLAEEERGEITDRFTIKDKYIDGFIHGDQTFLNKAVKKMQASSGKSKEDVEKFEKLVKDVQDMIVKNNMQPILRTYYKRTAFQIPGDTTVRMALDTDVCFFREDTELFSKDGVIRRPNHTWRRPDVDINYPFPTLEKDTEIERYPFATFEIKMDLAPDESVPEWVTELEESGILEEAHQFSKFVHGVAVLFDTRVALLPYWLAQVDDDIQQLPVLPSQTPSVAKKGTKGKGRASPPSDPENTVNDEDVRLVIEEPSFRQRKRTPAATERTSLLGNTTQPSTSYTGITLRTPSQPEENWLTKLKYLPFNVCGAFRSPFTTPSNAKKREPVVLPPGVKVPQKVVTPLRVEPKVFFANERTYFSWMSFGTLMATFSIALFNAGDAVGKVSGVVYTLVSLSTLIYGVGLYYRRRELIRARAPGPYDDTTGPTVICFALLFAVGLNAYLKFTVHSPSHLNLF